MEPRTRTPDITLENTSENTSDMTSDRLYSEFRRAEVQLEFGQPLAAARIVGPVVEAAPESTAALELYARALFASAQLGRAEGAFRDLVDRCPDDGWARLGLARTLERRGRADEGAGHRRVAQALGVED